MIGMIHHENERGKTTCNEERTRENRTGHYDRDNLPSVISSFRKGPEKFRRVAPVRS
jgi:hypothetical protein